MIKYLTNSISFCHMNAREPNVCWDAQRPGTREIGSPAPSAFAPAASSFAPASSAASSFATNPGWGKRTTNGSDDSDDSDVNHHPSVPSNAKTEEKDIIELSSDDEESVHESTQSSTAYQVSRFVPATASPNAINAVKRHKARPLPDGRKECDQMDIRNLNAIVQRIREEPISDRPSALERLAKTLGEWEWRRKEPADPAANDLYEDYAMEAPCIHSYQVLSGIDTTRANYLLKSKFKCPNPETRGDANVMAYGYITPPAEPSSIATIRGAEIVYNAVATVFDSGIEYHNTFGIKASCINRANFCVQKVVRKKHPDGTVTQTMHCCEWCINCARRACYILLCEVEVVCGTFQLTYILDTAGGTLGCATAVTEFKRLLSKLPQSVQDLVVVIEDGNHFSHVDTFLGWRDSNRMTAIQQREMVTVN